MMTPSSLPSALYFFSLTLSITVGMTSCTDIYLLDSTISLQSGDLDAERLHFERTHTIDEALVDTLDEATQAFSAETDSALSIDHAPTELNDDSGRPTSGNTPEHHHNAESESIRAVNVRWAAESEDYAPLGDEGEETEATDDPGEMDEGYDGHTLGDLSAADLTPPQAPWLLSIDGATDTLRKINTATGAGEVVCELDGTGSYPSLTFGRDGTLFAARGGNALDIIDPCTCEVTQLGAMSGFGGVNGITTDQGVGLFGVSSGSDVLLDIETTTGASDVIGELGEDFGASGSTWSDQDEVLYAINSNDDALYQVDPETGEAEYVADLDLPFGSVGIELHPEDEVIYACSNAADLLSVDKLTGEVTIIGHMGHVGGCSNLAAPYVPVPCIDTL